jgi:hypothetical protein
VSGDGDPEPTLPFLVTADDPDDADVMGGLFRRPDADVVLRDIPLRALRASIRATVEAVCSLFDDVADMRGPVRLREAQVGVEVSASGGIQLIGTAQVGATGGITLVFRQD